MARSSSDIQADLTVAYASRRSAMQASSYSASGQSVSRDLKTINETIGLLEAELAGVEAAADGSGSIQFIPTVRSW